MDSSSDRIWMEHVPPGSPARDALEDFLRRMQPIVMAFVKPNFVDPQASTEVLNRTLETLAKAWLTEPHFQARVAEPAYLASWIARTVDWRSNDYYRSVSAWDRRKRSLPSLGAFEEALAYPTHTRVDAFLKGWETAPRDGHAGERRAPIAVETSGALQSVDSIETAAARPLDGQQPAAAFGRSPSDASPSGAYRFARGRTDGDLLAEESARMFQRALEGLTDRQRRVWELKHRQGLRNREIARELGISEMGVSNLLARARQHLREELADYVLDGNGVWPSAETFEMIQMHTDPHVRRYRAEKAKRAARRLPGAPEQP